MNHVSLYLVYTKDKNVILCKVRKKVHPKKKVEINFKKSVTKEYSISDQKSKKTKKSLYHMTKTILQMIKSRTE
jgi:hypothetical protein